MKLKNHLSSLALIGAALTISPASATVLPYGVHNDVAATTVTNTWGFTECFSATYGTFGLTTNGMLSNCQGDYLMLAARRAGSSVFEVLAAANFSDATYDTGTGNITHTANGAEWYFNNNWSWGFAGLGDAVARNSCDLYGQSERDRLCWHTHSGYSGGFRAGNHIWLNDDHTWEKVLLVASEDNDIPEPSLLALLGASLVGFTFFRRRPM